jgi:septal ring factor EnvC (AmiA/AmiB activator)
MRWLARLVVVVLAVSAARELHERQQKVLAIGADLGQQRRGIETAEAELDATDRSIDDAASHVRELDAQITAIEHEHPGGIPASVKAEYTELIQRHNDAVAMHNDLIGRQRRLNDEYQAQVDRHNALVADANTYAAAGGPCSLLPAWLRTRVCGESD